MINRAKTPDYKDGLFECRWCREYKMSGEFPKGNFNKNRNMHCLLCLEKYGTEIQEKLNREYQRNRKIKLYFKNKKNKQKHLVYLKKVHKSGLELLKDIDPVEYEKALKIKDDTKKRRAKMCVARKKKNRKNNPEKHRKYARERYQNPGEKERINEYFKNRRKNNTEYKIAMTLRNRILKTIKKDGGEKNTKFNELLGCSIKQARIHIESQFKDNMSWDNHGLHGWHIDHKTPCASFDLKDPEEQKICFHYSNLQPLWAKDNLSKGCKI